MWLRRSLRRLLDKPVGRLTTYRYRIAALLKVIRAGYITSQSRIMKGWICYEQD